MGLGVSLGVAVRVLEAGGCIGVPLVPKNGRGCSAASLAASSPSISSPPLTPAAVSLSCTSASSSLTPAAAAALATTCRQLPGPSALLLPAPVAPVPLLLPGGGLGWVAGAALPKRAARRCRISCSRSSPSPAGSAAPLPTCCGG
ncbi:hypothetical protein V8C86DRAFT_2704869 [Haematococcus lacustris]